jgi:type I restriction enzyme, S subunit
MSKPEKKVLVPMLRFPAFKDAGEWEEKTLRDLCEISNGKSNAQDHIEGGLYPLFDRSEVIKGANEYLFDCEAVILPGEGMRFVPKYYEGKFDLHQRAYALKNFSCEGKFVYYTMAARSGLLARKAVQSTVLSLRLPILKNFPVLIPKDREEQRKIADCLTSVDELITAHTRKLDALKTHKKGLIQKLFPAGNETVPQLRFPEFRDKGEWQLKPIREVLIEQPRPIDMQDEQEYSLVTVKRRYGGLVSRGVFKGKSIKVKSQFLLHENDFLISKRQIVHCACGVVPKELTGSIVSNEYSVLIPRKKYDIHFLNYFSQQPIVSESFLQCSIGIVIEKMLFKLNDWLKQEFPFPDYDEQKKVAQLLSNLDDLIESQTQKLETLKDHKKGLMQQLFPATDEVSA